MSKPRHFVSYALACSAMVYTVEGLAQDVLPLSRRVAERLEAVSDHLSDTDRSTVLRSLTSVDDILNYYDEVADDPFAFTLEGLTLKVSDRVTARQIFTWNNHDQMEIRGPLLALLDKTNEFAALRYENNTVTMLVEKWKDVKSYRVTRDYIGLLDNQGVVDIYSSKEKKKLVSGWKNVIKHNFDPNYIILLDNEPQHHLDVYDVKGARVIAITDAADFRIFTRYKLEYTTMQGETRVVDLRPFLP